MFYWKTLHSYECYFAMYHIAKCCRSSGALHGSSIPNYSGLLQQDVPCHTAKYIQEPTGSPDLYLMEHPWNILDKLDIHGGPSRNAQHLKDLMLLSWCQSPGLSGSELFWSHVLDLHNVQKYIFCYRQEMIQNVLDLCNYKIAPNRFEAALGIHCSIP